MNKLFALVGFVAFLGFAQASQANEQDLAFAGNLLYTLELRTAQPPITALDLINWKVGDTANYSLTISQMGNIGTMVNTVTKDEGRAIWLKEVVNAMGQNQTVEALFNKADGKILKYIVNGQEKSIPNEQVTIISQDYTTVTVPAGTFKCIHVVAKTKDTDNLQVWANPKEVVIDGSIKTEMPVQGMDLTMELTSQSHGS